MTKNYICTGAICNIRLATYIDKKVVTNEQTAHLMASDITEHESSYFWRRVPLRRGHSICSRCAPEQSSVNSSQSSVPTWRCQPPLGKCSIASGTSRLLRDSRHAVGGGGSCARRSLRRHGPPLVTWAARLSAPDAALAEVVVAWTWE